MSSIYSLQDEINEKRDNSRISDSARTTMLNAIENLKNSGIKDRIIKKGSKYIDFTLPNIHQKNIKLSNELEKGPVILTFYRGGWCPYCNLQLRSYQKHLEQFQELGAQLIAVSPEKMDAAQQTSQNQEISYQVLSDDSNTQARKYGLVFKLDDDLREVYLKFGIDLQENQANENWELPVSATYVIDQAGTITYSFIDVDYIKRAEPKDIIAALKKITKEKK